MSWLQLPRFLRSRRQSSPGKTGARAAAPRPPFRKTVLFEAMEPRLLLSADPLVTVVGGDVTVTFDGTDNDVLLSINAGVGGGLVVGQTNTTLNSVLIPVPTGSLTLNFGFGADRLAVANLSSLGAFNLVVNDPNDVTIISDVRLNGSLTVNAGEDIVVNDNLVIDVGGNITFNVVAGYALTWAAITPVFQNLDAIGSIDIGDNVLLDGGNISLSVETNNTKQAEFEIDEIALQSFTPAQLANIFIPALPEGLTVSFADAGGANPDTITRSSGLWADDGFVVGQFIEVAGATSNNGFFQIASVSGATMTLVAGNALVNEANVAAQLEVVRPMTGNPSVTFANNGAAADTITRNAGSWLDDGFAVGQSVIVRGTLADGADSGTDPDNSGEFLIASLTATTITLQPADTLLAETLSGLTIFVQGSPGEMPLAVIDPNVKLDGHIPLTFANAGSADTITRTVSSGSWLADGFVAGQEIVVVGTALNNGDFRIASLSATVMTLTSSASLTNETSSRADITSVNSLDGGVQEGAKQQDATTVAVTFAGNTVTLASGAWVGGFAVGDELVVFGSTSNDGSYTIVSRVGAVIAVEATVTFVNETTSDATISNLDAVTLTFSASQIFRSSGNWTTDGFAVGQQLSVEGSLNNDGGYVITALTPTTLTVAAPGFGAFIAEVTQAADITYIVSLADPLISFDAATGTITRNTGSWIDDGFVAGRNISVDLSQENNALYRVTAVSATTLTLAFTPASGLALTNELARFVEVKGIVPNQLVTGDANTPATAGSVFSGLGGALPSNILGNIGGLTSALNGYFAHAVQGESTGTITLGAGADLIASGDVTVLAHAISNVAVKTKGLIIGVSYAQSIAHASVDVQANVIINAAGNLNITSDADNTMASAVKVVAGFHPIIALKFKRLVPGPALGLSYGEADSQATTTIAGGAQLFGDNVTIAATDTNDFNVTTKAKIKGIKVPNLGNSIAVSLSFVESDADVTVNGNVTARDGDVKINASSIDLNNDVVAIAAVKRALGGAAGKAAGLAGGAGLKPASSSGAIGIAGGVAFAISNNAANATVGSTATLFANRDLSVTAYAEDNFKAIAMAGAKLASTVSIAGGVAITDYTNTADAVISNGATLNVRGLLTVRADAIIPNQVEIDDKFRELIAFRPFLAPSDAIVVNPAISPTDPISGVASSLSAGATTLANIAAFGTQTLAENAKLLGLIKPFIKHKMIVPNLLATTYTEASSGAKDKDTGETTKVAISGSVNVTDIENSAKAHLGQGALVNQDPALLALATQGVAVLAKASVESIHIAGMTSPLSLLKSVAGKPGAAGNKGQNAIGGTYLGVNYTGTAEAWIEDGAKVKAGAGGITVRADNHDLLIAIAQSGGVAEKIGITGSFMNYDSRHNTRAWVEDRAVLDSGGNIDVIAHADILAVEVTGAIESGGKVAAGAAIALTDVLNTTEAFIGNKLAPVGVVSAGSVDADGNVNIAADVDEQTITVAIAGAFVGGSASGQGPSNAQGNGPTNKTGGVGISGAVAINTLGDTTRAFVAGTVLSTLDATPGDLSVTADTSASGVAVTGAFVISKSKSGSIGIAGGFGMNDLTRNTEAYVDATASANNVTISATSSDSLVAVTAGAALSKLQGTANIAGSVTVGLANETAHAWIGDDATVNANGDVSVDAHTTVNIISVAGSIALGGKVGVGAALDFGVITSNVQAWVGSGTVNAGDDFALRASAYENILSIAASLVATNNVGLSGVVTTQTLDNTVKAELRSGADVRAKGDALIDAFDDTHVLVIGGSAAFGKKAGIGLAGANINLRRDVEAEAEAGSELDAYAIGSFGIGMALTAPDGAAVQGVRISARATGDIKTAAAAGAGGQTLAIAASAAVTTMTSDVDAGIGANVEVNQESEFTAETDQSVVINARDDMHMLGIGGGLSIGGKVGIGASADVELIDRHVGAAIGAGAKVKARDDITVSAVDTLDILSVTVTAAIAFSGSGVAVDGSVGVLDIDNDTQATIGANAIVDALDDITVNADADFGVLMIEAGVAGGAGAGFGGSVGVLLRDNTVGATIGAGARVTADGDLIVRADNRSDVIAVAGSLAIGGSLAGIGIASATVVHNETIEATVGNNAVLEALGQGSAASVATANGDVRATDTAFHGLSVTATNEQDAIVIAAAGAGGGKVGVAASAGVVVMNETTRAALGSGVSVNALDNGSVANGQGINVFADSDSYVIALGAGIAGGGNVGAGAGAGVVVMTKITEATLGGASFAQGNVRVQALSDDQLIIIGAAFGAGGSVGIAGGAAVNVLNVTTRAQISAAASVDADGSVVVAADDQTTLDVVGGSISGAGSVSLGGGAAVPIVTKTTEALVGAGAAVDARGQSSVAALTGVFSAASYVAQSNSDAEVAAPAGIGANTDQDDASLTGQRSVGNASNATFRGLSVTATNRDDVESAGVSVGGSGAVAIQIAASVNVMNVTTRAQIGADAQINQDNNAAANAAQTVQVAAASDYYHLGIAGAGGIAGSVSVTPGADVSVVAMTTEATIGTSADVDAKGDIVVSAKAQEDVLSIAVAIAGSGAVGAAAGVAVLVFTNTTTASIGADATAGAGGNVLVQASDATDLDVIAGAIGVGISGGGAGAGVGVVVIDKTTDAHIGSNATVDAAANGAAVAGMLNGDQADDGTFGSASMSGVLVQAQSSEDLFGVSAAAGVGGFVGLAGAVTVSVIDSDTLASIGGGASINTATSGENAAQRVNVSASNDVDMFMVDGVLAGSAGGSLAGGVDVGILRNDTSAFIGDSLTSDRGVIDAQQDVGVHALAQLDVQSVTVSAAIAIVGLGVGGAVAVYSLGGNFSGSYSYDNNGADAGGSASENSLQADNGSMQTVVDGQTSPTGAISALNAYGGQSAFAAGDVGSNTIDFAASPELRTGEAVVYRKGTASTPITGLVDGRTYYAIVDASDATKIKLAATKADALAFSTTNNTALAISSAGAGATGHSLASASADAVKRGTSSASSTVTANSPSNKVTTAVNAGPTAVTAGTSAFIGTNNTVTALRNIDLDARVDSQLKIVSGGLGGGAGAGVGASIIVVNADQDVSAEVRAGSVLSAGTAAGQGVFIDGKLDFDIDALAFAGGVGGVVGIAGGVVVFNETGSIFAGLADAASTAGGVQIIQAGTVAIKATSDVTVRASALGVGASFFAGAGASVVVVDANGTATAQLGDFAKIGTTGIGDVGSVAVESVANASVDNYPGFEPMTIAVGAGGIAGAAGGVAVVTIGADAKAVIGNDVATDISGELKVASSATDVIDIEADGAAIGLGVGIGVVIARADIVGSSRAQVQPRNAGSTSTLKAGSMKVTADASSSAKIHALAAAGGIIASGSGVDARTTVTPALEASIGSSVSVDLTGALEVRATHRTLFAEAVTEGYSVAGGLSIGVSIAKATVSPTVDASIGAAANIDTDGAASVKAQSFFAASRNAYAEASPSGGAILIGVNGGDATATASAQTNAQVGAGADIRAATGFTLEADATNLAQAAGENFSFGLLAGVGTINATAVTNGATKAIVAGSLSSDRANLTGGSVTVHAVSEDQSISKAKAASGGVISGTGSDAKAESKPTVEASIGANATVSIAQAIGDADLTVKAEYFAEADAIAEGYGGGVIRAGVSKGLSTLQPNVDASIASGSSVTTDGNVFVQALRQSAAAPVADLVTAVNGNNDTLNYGDFGLGTGDAVRYDSTGAAIGGLTDGRDYFVLSSAPSGTAGQVTLKLGVTFDGTQKTTTSGGATVTYGVNPSFDTIVFAGGHGLVTGDTVVYDGFESGAAAQQFRNTDGTTGVLLIGSKYFVRVIDGNTIKLFTTLAAATAAPTTNFSPKTNVNPAALPAGETININGHGFANGLAVTYRNAVTRNFSAPLVDLQFKANGTPDTTAAGAFIYNDSDTIYFTAAHGFAAGEAVQYRAAGGAALGIENGGGTLVNGGIYYVITVAGNSNALKLATTYANATAATPVAIDINESTDTQTLHTLSDPTLGGLESGRTYYVEVVDANNFRLRSTPAGTAIDLSYLPEAAAPTRNQFIGREGLDFNATTGTQRLRIDIADGVTTLPAGTHKLLGPGGVPLGQVSPPTGDGISAASATGSSGGLVDVANNTSTVTISQTVDASSAATIVAGGNVTIASTSATGASTSTSNSTGGVVAVKNSQATIAVTRSDANATLAGNVNAGGDVNIAATNASTQSSYAFAQGGGLVDLAEGASRAGLVSATLASIAADAVLVVGGALSLNAQLGGSVGSKTSVSAAGLGSDATGSAASTVSGSTKTQVGERADVRARTVSMVAKGSDLAVGADSDTFAGGLGVTNSSTATASLTNLASTLVDANVKLRGDRGVDLRAGYETTSVTTRAYANSDALGGDTTTISTATADTDALVRTSDAAHVTAGARVTGTPLKGVAGYDSLALLAETFGTRVVPGATAPRDGAVFDGGSSNPTANINGSGTVTWDADVLILSGQSPAVSISATGVVTVTPSTLTVTQTATEIIIPDIANTASGQVRFVGDTINDAVASVGNDFQSLFNFQETFDSVRITNLSSKSLIVGNIAVGATTAPLVDLIAPTVTLTFDLKRVAGSPEVRIENLHPSAATDIVLTGFIDNPTGRTIITAAHGDIVAYTDRDESRTRSGYTTPRSTLIETRSLELSAIEGTIGYDKDATDLDADGASGRNRISVDLIQGPIFMFDAAHGLLTGDVVTYAASTTALGGLTSGISYTVIRLDDFRLRLAANATDAVDGKAIGVDPANINTGTHTIQKSGAPLLTVTDGSKLVARAGGDAFIDLKGRLRDPAALLASPHVFTVELLDAGLAGNGSADLLLRAMVNETGTSGSGRVLVRSPNDPANANDSADDKYAVQYRPDVAAGAANAFDDVAFFGGGGSEMAGTYLLRNGSGAGATAGLVSRGTGYAGAAAADSAATATRINILGLTEVLGTGNLRFESNGFITLTEQTGDMRVGRIASTDDNVTLTSPASIVDAANGDAATPAGDFPAADVIGKTLTLTAASGGIGSATNWLEIDSGALGVIALALNDIYLDEAVGDMPVVTVRSTAGSVSLRTQAGSLLDANPLATASGQDSWNVQGINVNLDANGGGIGGGANGDFEIDSSVPSAGRLAAEADGDIFLTEIDGVLNVVLAESLNASVRLTVRESAADSDEDLVLDRFAAGAVRLGETDARTLVRGRIAAGIDVTLNVGDDMTATALSEILGGLDVATGFVKIYGDHLNLDSGRGTSILLQGTLTPGASAKTEVFGNNDVDTITFDQTTLGGNTIARGSNTATPAGTLLANTANDGEDRFIVNQLQSMAIGLDGIGHTLTIDGQADTDQVTVQTTGSQGAQRNYVINVLDSGAKDDGEDRLTILGNDAATAPAGSTDDIFLLRRMTTLPGVGAQNAPAFVALIHGDLNQARDGSGTVSGRPQQVQRINYDDNLNGRLEVLGQGGNDYFALDDTSAITTLDGGAGNDTFQIGQLYGSQRIATNLVASDAFSTLATTRGYLSRGGTLPVVAQGGAGNDVFNVYSNQAELRLEGDSGDDTFIVRSFVIAQTDATSGEILKDALGNALPLLTSQLSTQGQTLVRPGDGNDTVTFSVNAPVSVDGGSGFDKVVILGTEFNDNFVITEEGVFGSGTNVSFQNIEVLEIDGLESDDDFYVLGTPIGVITRVIGNLGSDTVNVGGDVAEPIQMSQLDGASSSISHRVASPGTLYDNLPAAGIDLTVAKAVTGAVVIEESSGSTLVQEGPTTSALSVDSYGVRLAVAPAAGTVVYITVSASRSQRDEENALGDSLWVSKTLPSSFTHSISVNGAPTVVPDRTLVLKFDSTNWNAAQQVYVYGVDDPLAEGERTVTVNHAVSAVVEAAGDAAAQAQTIATFNQAKVRNVEVRVIDNDQADIVVTPTNGSTLVVEGALPQGIDDSFNVKLAKPLTGAQTVTVQLAFDASQLSLSQSTITFNSGNWSSGVNVTVQAVDDATREDFKRSFVNLSVTGASAGTGYAGVTEQLAVEVHDNDRPGVLILESDGSTHVVNDDPATAANEAISDTYTVRLLQAPSANVTIAIATDGQATTVPTSLTFTAGNWFTPQTVTATGNPAFVPAPGGIDPTTTKIFAPQPHLLGNLGGPLEVVGGSTVARTLVAAVVLPRELNTPLPGFTVAAQADERDQIDTLNIYDDSSGEDKTGTLSGTGLTGLGMAPALNVGTNPFGVPATFPGGISFGDATSGRSSIEVLNLMLGEGNDTLTITGGLVPADEGVGALSGPARHGTITTVHGGGNSALAAGGSTIVGDRITVTGGGGTASPLVIYGDTSQDGLWYSGATNEVVPRADNLVLGAKLFDQPGNADDQFRFPRANPFHQAGNDVIDASALFTGADPNTTVLGVTIYGGAGNDTLTGSQAADHVAGGSGNDLINGGNGIDMIYGDSGFNVDPITRTLLVPVIDGGYATLPLGPVRDELIAGSDTINGGGGDDVIFGDHGVAQQDVPRGRVYTAFAPAMASRSAVFGYATGNTTELQQAFTASDKLLTTNFVQDLRSAEAANGAADTIHGDAGRDRIFGGNGGDSITGDAGSDVIFGDQGHMSYLGPDYDGTTETGLAGLGTLDLIESVDMQSALGGADTIGDDAGDDIILGGQGADTVDAGAGQNIVFGDHGQLLGLDTGVNRPVGDPAKTDDDYQMQVLGRVASIGVGAVNGAANSLGNGNDTITSGIGRDMIFGGGGDDTIVANAGETAAAGDGNNIVFGDHGFVDYLVGERASAVAADPPRSDDIDIVSSLDAATTLGGNDSITTGNRNDIVIGGTGNDVINAGNGNNIALGDNARLSADRQDQDASATFAVHAFTLARIETFGFADAESGNDTLRAGSGNDLLFGGGGSDTAFAGAGNDLVFGDQGLVEARNGRPFDPSDPASLPPQRWNLFPAGDPRNGNIEFLATNTTVNTGSGNDLLYGQDGMDLLMGQQGQDVAYGGNGDDVLIGGSNVAGALDASDRLDGGAGNDAIAGDNAQIWYRPDNLDPRMRAVLGTAIYGTTHNVDAGQALITPLGAGGVPAFADPRGNLPGNANAVHREYLIQLLDHSATLETTRPDLFGNDVIAGGADEDEIFGQLGNDVIQGDGSIGVTLADAAHPAADITPLNFALAAGGTLIVSAPTTYGASRTTAATGVGDLTITPSFEGAADGDDYIEGNGGNDVIFGNLGQDDIVGGSSDMFGLGTPALRPDGADLIFGGAGTDTSRNNAGDSGNGLHARDADNIAGDNANIVRLVGTNGSGSGAFLAFNYDNYAGSLRIVPRAVQLLDYTPGGPDYTAAVEAAPANIAINPATGLRDIGAGDEVHAESGDDIVYGMVGNDALYGDGQDDNIVGGYGSDWISGGSGDDGVLGDDGRLLVSRNSTSFGEPLYGIAAIPAGQINLLINNASGSTTAITNVAGALKYTADMTPYSVDPSNAAPSTAMPRALYASDMIFGGLGHDALHGGAGEDAISGGEAMAVSYVNSYAQDGSKLNAAPILSDFAHPFNPGNVLGYNPATTKFALYDADDPLRKILLTPTGALSKTGSGLEWAINFTESDGPIDTVWIAGTTYPGTNTDGDDHIFGDLGHDWLVGGTGRDTLWLGWGNDLGNADDRLSTAGGLNDGPDTNPSWEDFVYGGAGRDVLIANTGGDRLSDWTGEFNTFVVPWNAFGAPTVLRTLQPDLEAFIYALSKSQGADPTLAAQYGGSAARNGEPFGEAGVVRQEDAAWNDQNGGPRDPQGPNAKGQVDVTPSAGAQPLYLTARQAAPAPVQATLTEAQLASLVAEAKSRWALALGQADERLARLDGVQVTVGNLPPDRLAVTLGNTILIDGDAAGHGWYVDSTPADDREFGRRGGPAGIDLLSALSHEMGHLLGLDHAEGVMDGELGVGQRVTPRSAAGAPATPANDDAAPPAIDWTVRQATKTLLPVQPRSVAADTALLRPEDRWQQRFVNHLGATPERLNPNAGLKVHLPIVSRLTTL